MRDIPDSGNNVTGFSQNLYDFISAVNYFLKSGYFSPSEHEISLIYKFCTEISKMILRAKTDMKSAVNRYQLYNDYCRVRHMLSDSSFVNVVLYSEDEYADVCLLQLSQQFERINILYNKCRYSFPYSQTSDKNDVLIGVLRNRAQLDACLKNRFYHIPRKRLRSPAEEITYVAIYQSKNLFGNDAGIKYYGKVASYEIVRRRDIVEIPKDSSEEYYRFKILNWQSLPHIITNKSGLNVFETTSHNLLFRANDMKDIKQ